jgi:hypothetical protein
LRGLISDMLHTAPQQRPDLDQILRKPFVKKHVVNFFTDIVSRPSQSVGEGTIIMRAAAGKEGINEANFSRDEYMLSLRKQLQSLDMNDDIATALRPRAAPSDHHEAKKMVRDQAGALRREQEHKAMVQSALEKLRKEREQRARERAAVKPGYARDRGLRGGLGARGGVGGGGLRDARLTREKEAREREREEARKREEERELRRKAVEERRREAERERSEKREREREQERIEREKEMARARKEADEKEKREQAQAAALAKREVQRERERARQREEIEQLKKDKLELDRLARERARVREERWTEERRKIDEASRIRRDSNASAAPSEGSSYTSDEKSVPSTREPRDRSRGRERAEDKLSVDPREIGQAGLSARDRVLAQKKERQAKEDRDRADALRRAEEQNRMIRANADNRGRAQYGHAGAAAAIGMPTPSYEFESGRKPAPGVIGSGGSEGLSEMDELSKQLEEATGGANRYESQGDGQGRHGDAASGASRAAHATNEKDKVYVSDSSDDEDESRSNPWAGREAGAVQDEDEASFDDEEDIRMSREAELQAELNMATKRCQELKRTLKETKSFIDGKSGAAPSTKAKLPVVSNTDVGGNGSDDEASDDDASLVDEDDDIFDEESTEYEESPTITAAASAGSTAAGEESGSPVQAASVMPPSASVFGKAEAKSGTSEMTPRKVRPQPIAVKQSPYYGLQDPPSPMGKLGDRIVRLRQRCIEALGKGAFDDVYTFLKHVEEDGFSGYQEENETKKSDRVKAILGEGKAHYMPLIEQLIFMEETHAG